MRLKQWLEEQGMTHTQFADKHGFVRSTINRFVNDQAEPSLVTALRLHKITHGQVKFADMLLGKLQRREHG